MKFSCTSGLKNPCAAFLTQRRKDAKTQRKDKNFGFIRCIFASMRLPDNCQNLNAKTQRRKDVEGNNKKFSKFNYHFIYYLNFSLRLCVFASLRLIFLLFAGRDYKGVVSLFVKNAFKFHTLLVFTLISSPIGAEEMIIPGRDLSATYKIEIPDGWKTTFNTINLDHTTEPLATIEKEEIIITIHNFPSDSLLARVPALAQVARWKHQFSEIDKNTLKTTHVAWGGFSGLRFEATGKQKGKQLSIIAWSLLIASNYYNKLNSQQSADVTIKAIGPSHEISHNRETIFKMAESFELIQGIPSE